MADETRKETVILELEVDESDSIESINSLTKANKELRAERNALNLQSKEGQKRAQEINALLDQNTNKIKTNVSALEKQKINIGNYKSALDGVHPALGKVGEGLEAGASGFKAMTLQALRFIATPIGAILAGLVAVFTLLKTALTQNDSLMDKFENVTHAVGVVLEVVISRVAQLGEALIKLASGDFTGAIDDAAAAFKGLGDEIGNAVRQQQLFLDASRTLEDRTLALSIKTEKYENEIKRLIVAAKNRDLTFDQQEELLRKALALEEELIAERTDLARQDLLITARKTRVAQEFQQQQNENFDQYINRLLTSDKLGFEERKKIADKVNALEQARGASLPFQEKVANTLATIDEKRAEAAKKLAAALDEQAAQERAIQRAQQRPIRSKDEDPLVGAFQTQATLIDDIDKRMKDDLAKRDEQFQDERVRRAEQTAALIEQQQERELQATVGLFGSIASMLDQQSSEYKLFASAQALISTFATVQKSIEAAYTPPTVASPGLAVLYAANALAAGLANVARINGVQFAEGGLVLRGPSHAQGGIPIVAEGNEIIMTKGVYNNPNLRRQASALNVAGGGRSFADGGLVSSSLSQPIDQQLAVTNILKNMPPIIADWSEGRKVGKRIEFKEKISKR